MIIILTCETEECRNANIAIPFEGDVDHYICGVCMNEITNKVEQ
jgi:hypothetical protein